MNIFIYLTFYRTRICTYVFTTMWNGDILLFFVFQFVFVFYSSLNNLSAELWTVRVKLQFYQFLVCVCSVYLSTFIIIETLLNKIVQRQVQSGLSGPIYQSRAGQWVSFKFSPNKYQAINFTKIQTSGQNISLPN